MTDLAQRLNGALAAECPPLAAALSDLGRQAAFPPDIPFQAAEARGKQFNATIGQVTDGRGRILAPAAIEDQLAGMADDERNRALLYSPLEGLPELRAAWRAWQRRHAKADAPSSLPLVTVGLTHGLSLAADLFGGADRVVAVTSPFWGNYRQAFELRTGARIVSESAYCEARFDASAIARVLERIPEGIAALVILNFPSNPGGYSPTDSERRSIVGSLCAAADARPLVVVCDDAYAGLVHDPEISSQSIFWDLCTAHPNLSPIKVDGGTKEFSLFGGRVGFLTFAVRPDGDAAAALESKVKCLLRATVGSPVATTQMMLLRALETNGVDRQLEEIRSRLTRRCRTLREALDRVESPLLRAMAFNSGCFALLELASGLGMSANEVRRHLLDTEDTGLISIEPRYLRIAFCSVETERIEQLVQRIARGIEELAYMSERT